MIPQQPPYRQQFPKSGTCKTCPRQEDKHCLRCTPTDVDLDVQIDILFVAEQPEWPSSTNNSPFIGHGGRIVKKAIHYLEKSFPKYRDDLTLGFTYAVQCSPTEKEGDASPSKETMRHCSKNLAAYIKGRKPKLIVSMGAVASKQLGFKAKFNDLRGKITKMQDGTSVLVTYAKKALVAQPGLYETFKKDIQNAMSYALQSDVEKAGPATLDELSELYVFPKTVEEVEKLCDHIIGYADTGKPADWTISIDTETTTLYPEKKDAKIIAFCFAWGRGKATTILFDHPQAPKEYLDQLDRVRAAVSKVLASEKPKCFHNAKFDLKFLEYRYGFTVRNVRWDTLLGEHLLDEDKKGSYGLKALTAGWLPQYCGYEDKLHDILDSQNADIDRELKDLTGILTEEHKHYLNALQQYKKDLETHQLDTIEHACTQAQYLGTLRGYNFLKAEIAEQVKEWKVLKENRQKGVKLPLQPRMPKGARPAVPKAPKVPKRPKDPRSKKERKVFTDAGFENIPVKDLCVYGAIDADVTRRLVALQLKRIHKEQSQVDLLMKSHALPISRVLGDAEFHGTRIDRDYAVKLAAGLQEIIFDTERELYQMSEGSIIGKDVNLSSPQQLADVLYNWGWTHPNGTKHVYPCNVKTKHNQPWSMRMRKKKYLLKKHIL